MHHMTKTEGDFIYSLICLRNGRQEKKANIRNMPDIVASPLCSTQIGNCMIVAIRGTRTSIDTAAALMIFPLVAFFIMLFPPVLQYFSHLLF